MTRGAQQFSGIPFTPLPVPVPLLALACTVAVYTTARVAVAIGARARASQPVAWNGVMAYGVSLYAWLLVRHPIVLLWVPLFHSLQYMAVVWRYRINREHSAAGTTRPALRLALFGVTSIGLGYLGFWLAPSWLDAHVSYDRVAFGNDLLFFRLGSSSTFTITFWTR